MTDKDFKPTKFQELALFILQFLDRELGSIELAKFIYLIDIENNQYFGESVTDEEYIYAPKGPLARSFENLIQELLGYEVERFEGKSSGRSGMPKNCHIVGSNPRFQPELSLVEEAIAVKFLSRTRNLSVLDLEKLAYGTEPMRADGVKEGTVLDLSLVVKDEGFSRWQENKKEPSPEYREYLRREREENDVLLAALK